MLTSYSLVTLYFPLLVLGIISTALIKYAIASRRPSHFPPGPPVLPILGNVHQLPLNKAFLKFHEWNKEYGSIVGFKLGPQNVVLLNSYRHVRDLFDKRGGIYSSRPPNHVGNNVLCPNGVHILLLPYGQEWRLLRKAIQSMLNSKAVGSVVHIQEAESTQTLVQLLQDPQESFKHIRRFTTALILASVYGQRGESYESKKVQALYHAQEQFTAILAPGATPPMDGFTFLKHLPEFMSPWRAKARTIRHEQRSLYHSLLNESKQRIRNSRSPDCFVARLLAEQEKNGLDEEHIAYLCGTMMEAGSDTTASTLQSWLIAMTQEPEVLKKMQIELDQLCCNDRVPKAEDVDKLPYTEAVMIETLRWRPVAPGGIPHCLTQDDHYEGYFLPKGTIVFANTWSIHQDDSEYDQPSQFKPERFLNNKFGTKSNESVAYNDRRVTYAFGAGRRVCQGQRLAESSLMLMMARIAWAFDISADPTSPVDSSIDTGYSDGFVFAPDPFKVQITVRSPKHEEIILQEFGAAKTIFATYED